jgi:hypothetical protein
MLSAMVGGLLETLTAAIDELAAIDLDTLDDSELHELVVVWAGCRPGWRQPGAG